MYDLFMNFYDFLLEKEISKDQDESNIGNNHGYNQYNSSSNIAILIAPINRVH